MFTNLCDSLGDWLGNATIIHLYSYRPCWVALPYSWNNGADKSYICVQSFQWSV